MTDRPIIFSGPMVQALLAGRKTQTRRILKPQPPSDARYTGIHYASDEPDSWFFNSRIGSRKIPVRFDDGDRLWVRESVACGACAPGKPSHWSPSFWRREQGSTANPNGLWYAADGMEPDAKITDRGRWVPSIHMPRWASRLTLLVTDVRVQRLQDISEEDAYSEGIETDLWDMAPVGRRYGHDDAWFVGWPIGDAEPCVSVEADEVGRRSFQSLWESLHGAQAWAENPYVAAVSFEVQRGNIDALKVAA